MTDSTVPFYFGLGSRYSYLAAAQLEAIQARTGCRFEWLPLRSAELIRRANSGKSPFEGTAPSGQYDWAFRQHDAEAWARYYGVPYREPDEPGLDTADFAHACWVANEHGKLKEMCWQIFQAKFSEPRDLSRDGLGVLAGEIGLNPEEFLARLDAPEIILKHQSVMDQALRDGIFGVPAFIVNRQLFWGNDRLVLVEQALKTPG